MSVPQVSQTNSCTSWLLPAGVCAATLILFFGRSFVFGELFLFRDAAHFYYPLFQEVTRQWARGEIPLWCPWDGIGVPLAADATSSVFYPGKLLLIGPWRYDHGFRLYVICHYLLAFAGAFFLARSIKLSTTAATFSAVAYAFGGPMISYHANLVYLVGGAWLPWTFLFAIQLLQKSRWWPMLGLTSCLAMMIFGGDPQLAAHVVLIQVLVAIFSPIATEPLKAWRERIKNRGRKLFVIGCCIVLVGLLTAIQVLPTWEWSRRSQRTASRDATNIYQLAVAYRDADPNRAGTSWENILGKPIAETHADHSYDFSIAPWSWPELGIPTFCGQMYPENQRWTNTIPAEGRVWFPSLFMGSLAIFFAAIGCFRLDTDSPLRWLRWVLLFAALASLGWYGLGWLWIEFGNATGWFSSDDVAIGSPFGGLYWLLNISVPGYSSFRYPAKWWIFVSLIIPLLAGRGIDRVTDVTKQQGTWIPSTSLDLACGFGIVIGGLLYLFAEGLGSCLPEVTADGYFGPLDQGTGIRNLAWGIVQTSLVLLAGRRLLVWKGPLRSYGLVAVLMFELFLGNGWIVQTAPQQLFHSQSNLRLAATDDDPLPGIYRGRYDNYYPAEFALQTSPNRQIEALKIDHQSLFPRHHLTKPVRSIHSFTSIEAADYSALFQCSDEPFARQQLQNMLGAKQIWTANRGQLVVATNQQAWPAAWTQSQTSVIGQSKQRDHYIATFDYFKFQRRMPTEYRYALIESAQGTMVGLKVARQPAGKVTVRRPAASKIELEFSENQHNWLIVREYFDPGWRCQIQTTGGKTRDAEVVRANRIMMAVRIQPGDQSATLTYRPTSFVIGAYISIASWIAILIGSASAYCLLRRATAKSGS